MPNSELSTVSTINDVSAEQLNAINRALLTVWNEAYDWNFRYKSTNFNTVAGTSDYSMVNGVIKEDGLKINGKPLAYEPNYEFVTISDGTPTMYWIEGDNIVLNPKPIDVKAVTVKYRNKYAVKTSENVEQSTFINSTDVLNIPLRVEDEFIDCIGHLTNKFLNADRTDEDYVEHFDNYKKSLTILKQVDTGTQDNYAGFTI